MCLINTNQLKKYLSKNRIRVFIDAMSRGLVKTINKPCDIVYADGRVASMWIKHYSLNEAIVAMKKKTNIHNQNKSNEDFLRVLYKIKKEINE